MLLCKHSSFWKPLLYKAQFKSDPAPAKHVLHLPFPVHKCNNLMGLLTNTTTHGRAIQSSDLPRHSISLKGMQEASDTQNTRILFTRLLFHLIPDNPNHVGTHLLRDPLSSLFGLNAAVALPSEFLPQVLDQSSRRKEAAAQPPVLGFGFLIWKAIHHFQKAHTQSSQVG